MTDLQSGPCDGCGTEIFTAVASGSTGSEMADKVSGAGAKRLVDLGPGVSRLAMLRSAGADKPEHESELGH